MGNECSLCQGSEDGEEANTIHHPQVPSISEEEPPGEETERKCKICALASASRQGQKEMISYSDIGDIIKDLGRDDLQRFYISLGLESPDIEKAEYDANTTSVDLKARTVLGTWRKREAGEATRGKVLQALENSGNLAARTDLEEQWKFKAKMDSYQLHQNANICREELIQFYKREMSQVRLLPWCDDTRDMDDIYVNLELAEQRNRDRAKLEKNVDLVTLKNRQGMPATRVLVKGVAGSGKSTLLARLAYSWAQQISDSPLAKFELLFIISLREVERNSSLIDVIFQQLLARDTKVSNDDLLTFIESHSDRIIIFLDGFDEYKTKNMSSEIGINGILAFKLLRECRVILSTRPYAHLDSHQLRYVPIELTGFSLENVKFYITQFFDGNTDMVNGLIRRLSESKILDSLSTIPVMLMLMCLLWEDEQKLPDTQSELYQEFTLYLWKKYCIKQGIRNDVEDSCGGANFNSAILRLGRVAFVGLCPSENIHKEKLVFSESDFVESADLLDTGCSIGLLTRESLRSRLNKRSAVTFLHKSFQEFCAAKYWTSLMLTNPNEFYRVLMQVNSWETFESKIEFLKFCCGLVHNIGAIVIIHHVLNIFVKKYSDAKLFSVGKDSRSYGTYEVIPFEPILTFMNETQISWNDRSCVLLKTNQKLIKFCKKKPSFHQLANIDSLKQIFTGYEFKVLGDPPDTISMFHHFVKSKFGSSLTAIKSVTFHDIPTEYVDVIGDTLECMPKLQKLHIKLTQREACLQPINLKHLCEKLSTLSTLNEVWLGDAINIPSLIIWCAPEIIAAILDAIRSKIEKMTMHHIHVADAIRHIGHIMTPRLQILELKNAMLREDDIKILSEFLPKASHLNYLNLSDNTVGMAVVPLAQQLQFCTRLSRLMLDDTRLTDQGAIKLAKRFLLLPNLTELHISRNNVGNTSAHAVFKNLHHLITLKHFGITLRVDNQCSALVKECVTVIGEKVPDTGFLDINIQYPPMEYKTIARIRKIGLKNQ